MGGRRILSDITQPNVVSRYLNLAVTVLALLDVTVHPEDEKLLEGTLLGKIVANGKFRAYPEAEVAVAGDFSAASADFTIEDQDALLKMKHFRIGDTIESTLGVALGEILTFNPVTGVGTLTGNSANALAAGLFVRVVAAELSLANGDGRILKGETLMPTPSADSPQAAYVEGFFTDARVIGLTLASGLAMGAKSFVAGETRLI